MDKAIVACRWPRPLHEIVRLATIRPSVANTLMRPQAWTESSSAADEPSSAAEAADILGSFLGKAEEAASRGRSISTLVFIVGEVFLLTVTQAVGGSPWTCVALAAVVPLGFLRPDAVTIALAMSCLVWPAATQATGNRELFFPFAMQLAAVVVCRGVHRGLVTAIAGGAAVVAVFLGVRLWQAATARVLAVELIVAAVILAGTVAARVRSGPRGAADVVIVAAAALAAYAGLAL